MAATTATDYTQIASVVNGYAIANLTKKISLVASGAVREVNDAVFTEGNMVLFRGDIPYGSAWQTPTANTNLTVNSVAKYADYGVVCRRADAFGSEEFARYAGGDDNAVARLGTEMAQHSAWNIEQSIGYVLQGLFTSGGTLADTSLALVSDGTPFDPAQISKALKLKGEFAPEIEMILMHPDVYYGHEINKQVSGVDFATMREINATGAAYGGLLHGKMVILNSRLYNSGTTYHTYLVKPGAIMLGWQKNFNVEAKRDILLAAGTDIVKYDLAYCPHVVGTSYTGSAVTALGGATAANLYTTTNWTKRTSITAAEMGVLCIETVEG